MKYGYVRVAAAVPKVKVADCRFTANHIEEQIAIAAGKGVEIIAFPELCVTGYTCGDLFAQQILIDEAENALFHILTVTRQLDIISIIGMPVACSGALLYPITRNFMKSVGSRLDMKFRRDKSGFVDKMLQSARICFLIQ